jgi:glucokinase
MDENDFVMGVDVGSTKILVGYVDRRGGVLGSQRFPMNRANTAAVLDSVYSALEGFLAAQRNLPRPAAMGLGLVGRCDPFTGCWVRAFNLPIPEPVEITGEIRSRFGLDAWIDNDVFCATRAEIAWGAGKDYRDFLFLNVGTGLSVGIVADGRLLRGAGNAAGEVGQWHFFPEPISGAGSAGAAPATDLTLEQICSGGGMIERALYLMQEEGSVLANLGEGDLHSRSIWEAAQGGDAVAKRIINDALHGLSEAVSSLAAVFNPSAVVLAGSVACTPGFLEEIERYVRVHAYPGCLPDLKEIRLSVLEPRTVGLIGAARAAWDGLELA